MAQFARDPLWSQFATPQGFPDLPTPSMWTPNMNVKEDFSKSELFPSLPSSHPRALAVGLFPVESRGSSQSSFSSQPEGGVIVLDTAMPAFSPQSQPQPVPLMRSLPEVDRLLMAAESMGAGPRLDTRNPRCTIETVGSTSPAFHADSAPALPLSGPRPSLPGSIDLHTRPAQSSTPLSADTLLSYLVSCGHSLSEAKAAIASTLGGQDPAPSPPAPTATATQLAPSVSPLTFQQSEPSSENSLSPRALKQDPGSAEGTENEGSRDLSEDGAPQPVAKNEKLRKHREVEIRRRRALNDCFADLSAACACNISKKRTVLKIAAELIKMQDAYIEQLEAAAPHLKRSTPTRQQVLTQLGIGVKKRRPSAKRAKPAVPAPAPLAPVQEVRSLPTPVTPQDAPMHSPFASTPSSFSSRGPSDNALSVAMTLRSSPPPPPDPTQLLLDSLPAGALPFFAAGGPPRLQLLQQLAQAHSQAPRGAHPQPLFPASRESKSSAMVVQTPHMAYNPQMSQNAMSWILNAYSRHAFRINAKSVFMDQNVPMDLVTFGGIFVDCNERFADLLGYSKQELIDGRFTFFRLTHPDSMNATKSLLDALLACPPGTVQVIRKKYVRRDGSLVVARLTCWLLLDEAGAPNYISAICEAE